MIYTSALIYLCEREGIPIPGDGFKNLCDEVESGESLVAIHININSWKIATIIKNKVQYNLVINTDPDAKFWALSNKKIKNAERIF